MGEGCFDYEGEAGEDEAEERLRRHFRWLGYLNCGLYEERGGGDGDDILECGFVVRRMVMMLIMQVRCALEVDLGIAERRSQVQLIG